MVEAKDAQEWELLANNRIARAHYGYIEESNSTLLYVLPVNVGDVRPRDMDKLYMTIDAGRIRANDHYVDEERGINAQTQEAAFLAAVEKQDNVDIDTVKMALEVIKWYHGPQNRHSGEPFYLHPLTVAQIVMEYNADEAMIVGALLHDTVEDTPIQLQHIEDFFGLETAEVVDVVTHMNSPAGDIRKVQLSEEENLKMLIKTKRTRAECEAR